MPKTYLEAKKCDENLGNFYSFEKNIVFSCWNEKCEAKIVIQKKQFFFFAVGKGKRSKAISQFFRLNAQKGSKINPILLYFTSKQK